MNRILRSILLVMLAFTPVAVFAQSQGIQGTVKDPKGEPVVNASVLVFEGGIRRAISGTDFDGKYEIKPLNVGEYMVVFTNQGMSDTLTGVTVNANDLSRVDYRFKDGKVLVGVVVHKSRYEVPLIDNSGHNNRQKGADIEHRADQSLAGTVALGTGVQVNKNGSFNIGGGRTTGNTTIIDGVQYPIGSLGTQSLPVNSVEEVTTYTSGVPARYGDVSGGIISVTSKGITSKLGGSLRLEHSVDGYNHNQGSFFLSGPIVNQWSDSTRTRKSTVAGFTLAGEVVYDKDQTPNFDGAYVLSDAAQARVDAHPLIPIQSTTGAPTLGYATEQITSADIQNQKQRQNAQYFSVKLNPKLDYQLSPNLTLTAGATLFGNKSHDVDRVLGLYSSANYAERQVYSGAGYLRFTQKFGRPGVNSNALNTINNAFYTVQANYKKDYQTVQDADHKHNTFDYGYVGKFIESYVPQYFPGTDDSSGKNGIRLLGYQETNVQFIPSDKNPILANYTKDFYNFYGSENVLSQSQIASGKGLRNGDNPLDAYSIWRNAGYPTRSWSTRNDDQIAINIDASFDYNTKLAKHSIQFGLSYQQINQRFYAIGGGTLWNIMRQLTGDVVDGRVDFTKPVYIIGGKTYTLDQVRAGVVNVSPSDTIFYQRDFRQGRQTAFDRNLRAKLGVGDHDYINVDALDPSFFTLDMFGADDILNSGNAAATYYGYDYTGKLINGSVNFNDFWTAKDKNGYSRPIGAYRPNYIAGYISDYIQFKQDVKFNIGVRIERFDNNTKVLKDPYSLYATNSVGDNNGKAIGARAVNSLNGGVDPSNIGSDYVVYVANNTSKTPTIVGYRNGDDWYDYSGKQIEDPQSLRTYTNGVDPQPYLKNATEKITDSSFHPDQSFTDYKPVVNVMPRINFSFPINDNALFYAHYDVLVQRPETQAEAYATPVDYYFMEANQTRSPIYANSNLKPQRTIDYEVGFQQLLNKNSSITITGFYKERKDQIQIRPYITAYPVTYYAYGNRDFSTTKGLSLSYDLRRIGNVSMGINYTLQFAEGTGSDVSSGNGGDRNTVSSSGYLQNFISASLPNLRNPFALNYDSRHNINANIDYRYVTGQGPVVGGRHIFENAGANLTFFTRSGEPYTVYQESQTLLTGVHNNSIIYGGVNGSRLPWHYSLNLRVDKQFVLDFNKKPADAAAPRRTSGLGMTVYVAVTNLLNTRDEISVYGFTGRAGDDGYLTSPAGIGSINGSVNQQAFIDQYNLRANNPDQLNNPRRLNIGLNVSF